MAAGTSGICAVPARDALQPGATRLSPAGNAELPLHFQLGAAGRALPYGQVLAAVRAEVDFASFGEFAPAIAAARGVGVRHDRRGSRDGRRDDLRGRSRHLRGRCRRHSARSGQLERGAASHLCLTSRCSARTACRHCRLAIESAHCSRSDRDGRGAPGAKCRQVGVRRFQLRTQRRLHLGIAVIIHDRRTAAA
jgi:hypothetical protein